MGRRDVCKCESLRKEKFLCVCRWGNWAEGVIEQEKNIQENEILDSV